MSSPEYELGYCPQCSGSGEGATEHDTCWACRGRGEVWMEVEPEPEEEEETENT